MFLQFMRDRRAWGSSIGGEPEFIEQLFSVIAQRFYGRRAQDVARRAEGS